MNTGLARYFYREYRKRRRRVALITFAIAWGSFSLLALLAFGQGLATQFQKAFHGFGSNMIIVYSGQTLKPYKGLPKGRPIRFHHEDIRLLRERIPEIEDLSPESERMAELEYNNKKINRWVAGAYPAFAELRSQVPQPGGRFLDPMDERMRRRVAFIGWQVAEELFGNQLPVGKWFHINGIPFRVIGVLKPKMQNSMYQGPDADKVVIPFSTFMTFFGTDRVARIHVKPRDPKRHKELERMIRTVLGSKYQFDPEDPYAVVFDNLIESEEITGKVFTGILVFLGVVGLMTLLVAAVGVTNIMYASVRERTREIGIKMALGTRRRTIILQFMGETLLIFGRGAFWGLLLAWDLVHLIRAIPVDEGDWTSVMAYLGRPQFSPGIALAYFIIMGAFVFFSGIFPAVRAARLNPIEALRYE